MERERYQMQKAAAGRERALAGNAEREGRNEDRIRHLNAVDYHLSEMRNAEAQLDWLRTNRTYLIGRDG